MRTPDRSDSRTSGSVLDADRPGSTGSAGALGSGGEESVGAGVEIDDSDLDEIRRLLAAGDTMFFPHLEDRVRRSLGVAPLSLAASGLVFMIAVGLRLAPALMATAGFADWTSIPWGRWAVVLGFFGAVDVATSFMNRPSDTPSSPAAGGMAEQWTALLTSLETETGLVDLAAFTRRWFRPAVGAVVGVLVAAALLLASWLADPTALSELHPGTVVLVSLLLFEFGQGIVHSQVFQVAFLAREATYEFDLFWPSPVDTPQVKTALRMETGFGLLNGMWIGIYLAMTVVLVTWHSLAALPLAVGFIVTGYLVTVCATVLNRSSIRKIVERSRDRWLSALQRRIESFGSPIADLSIEDSDRLHELIELHSIVRDAPATPRSTRSVVHSVAGLIVPTIVFLISVFGEVYAERIFDAILP